MSGYTIVKLPKCQVTKLLVPKMSGYTIVKLSKCQGTKLSVTKLSADLQKDIGT